MSNTTFDFIIQLVSPNITLTSDFKTTHRLINYFIIWKFSFFTIIKLTSNMYRMMLYCYAKYFNLSLLGISLRWIFSLGKFEWYIQSEFQFPHSPRCWRCRRAVPAHFSPSCSAPAGTPCAPRNTATASPPAPSPGSRTRRWRGRSGLGTVLRSDLPSWKWFDSKVAI